MTDVTVFLIGLLLTTIAAFAVVIYLRPHLYRILVDLCGTQERANFWTAFSNITLVLVPVIFAMSYRPRLAPDTALVFEMGNQLKWALVGLVTSVVVLGLVISRFITPQLRPLPKAVVPSQVAAQVAERTHG
jgi:hypothetical protein